VIKVRTFSAAFSVSFLFAVCCGVFLSCDSEPTCFDLAVEDFVFSVPPTFEPLFTACLDPGCVFLGAELDFFCKKHY
jgi:hypothetical protein